jgi:hypothetical protein
MWEMTVFDCDCGRVDACWGDWYPCLCRVYVRVVTMVFLERIVKTDSSVKFFREAEYDETHS